MNTVFLVLCGTIIAAALMFVVLLLKVSLDDKDFWLKTLSAVLASLVFAVGIPALIVSHFAGKAQQQRIDAQQERLLILDKETAEAKRKLLETENRMAWRHDFDWIKFREVLERGARGHAEIWYLRDSAESYTFAETIWNGLVTSGWQVDQPKAGKVSNSDMPFFLREAGVMVTNTPQLAVSVSKDEELVGKPYKLDTPSGTLMAAFEAVGLSPLHQTLAGNMRAPSGAIKIVVGERW